VSNKPATPEPLEAALTHADDRLLTDHWMPPQAGIVPRVRVGRRWISVLWALPIGTVALMVLIAIAQALRDLPEVKAFIVRHPGIAQAAPSVDSGFLRWRRLSGQFGGLAKVGSGSFYAASFRSGLALSGASPG
jgi:hypothetical protein